MFDPDLDEDEFEFDEEFDTSLEDYLTEEDEDEPVWNVYENLAKFDDPEEIEDY
jgi:hypothetical protein